MKKEAKLWKSAVDGRKLFGEMWLRIGGGDPRGEDSSNRESLGRRQSDRDVARH
jgi:hypothetical protein